MNKHNLRLIKKSDIQILVLNTLREELEQLEIKSNINLSGTTELIGGQSVLDSLGLVNLILCIEQRLLEDYDISVTIADERAISRRKSPFRTVKSLTDYIYLLIDNLKQE